MVKKITGCYRKWKILASPTRVKGDSDMAVKDIVEAVLAFNAAEVVDLVKAEIAADTAVEEILNTGLIGAMDIVGKKFSDGDLFVPEMLMAAQAMKAGLEVLKPHLSGKAAVTRGTVVIGTVKGDLHDIGKNLVAMLMEGGGFNVVDLGVDIDAKQFTYKCDGSR